MIHSLPAHSHAEVSDSMRKFVIAFLRKPNPSLHSHAFLKRGPPPYLSFNTLASTPDGAEVGACNPHALPHISMGALETRKAHVRKARELKSDKLGCGSLHSVIPTSIAEEKAKARPTSVKAKRIAKAKATELSEIGVFKPEVHEEEETAATGKAEEAKFVFEEEKAVQNAKKELSEWVAKLDLNTFKRGRQWEEAACMLIDHGISFAHVRKMLSKCRSLPCNKKSVDSTLKHFTMLGMSHEQIGHVICRWPIFLKISNNVFQSKVEFFESLGIDKSSLGNIMHKAYRAMTLAPSTLRRRVDFWKDYLKDVQENAQENAIRSLILENPCILACNLQKTVKPSIAYLKELGFNKKVLLRTAIWGYSYENRIKYRLEVLQELKTLGAYRRNISLGYMVKMTDAIFSRRFVRRLQAYSNI